MKCPQQVNSVQLLDTLASLAAAAVQSEIQTIRRTTSDAEEPSLPQDFVTRIYVSGQRVYLVMNCRAFMGMVDE